MLRPTRPNRTWTLRSPSGLNFDLMTSPTVYNPTCRSLCLPPGLPDHVHPSLSHHQPHQLLLRQQHGPGRQPRHVRPRRFGLPARGRWDGEPQCGAGHWICPLSRRDERLSSIESLFLCNNLLITISDVFFSSFSSSTVYIAYCIFRRQKITMNMFKIWRQCVN